MLIKRIFIILKRFFKILFEIFYSVFLKVQLVQQQSDYIRTHTDLSVGCYHGELGVDFWSKEKWDSEFEKYQVLVLTAQVFLNVLDHNFFRKITRKKECFLNLK